MKKLLIILLFCGVSFAEWKGDYQLGSTSYTAGLWHFNKGTGSTAYDVSGQGNNGTITGALWIDSWLGKCLFFDGSDDVNVGDMGKYARTISLWLNPDTPITSASAYKIIMQIGGVNQQLLWLGAGTSSFLNEIIYIQAYGAATIGWCSSTESISADWHNLVLRHNGTNYEIYLDGIRKDNCYIVGDIEPFLADNVIIGARSAGTGIVNTAIDEVIISERSWSVAEILYRYEEQVGVR